MSDGVDADVAGACLDVLAYLCGDVGGAAQRAVAFGRIGHIGRVSFAQKFSRDRVRRFDALSQRAEYLDASAERRQFAAGAFSFHPDEIQAVGEAPGRDDVGHPAVAEARGALEWTFGASANPDRRAAGSSGLRLHADFAEAEIFAAMLDAIA